jgi:hypothetical protein
MSLCRECDEQGKVVVAIRWVAHRRAAEAVLQISKRQKTPRVWRGE